MKTQLNMIMRIKGFTLLLVCWPTFGLGAEIDTTPSKAGIETLLLHARTALARDRLMLPPGDNTVVYAQKVLNRSPGHPEARRILEDVVNRYGMIADAALDRAKALRATEVQKARIYRSRGGRIAKYYSVPDEKLQSVARRIAVLDKETIGPVEAAAIKEHPQGRVVLKRVVARYLDKSKDAVDFGSVKGARLYHDIARELAQSYRLPETGLQQLDKHIAEAEREYGNREGRMASAPAKVARDKIVPAKVPRVFLPPAF